MLNITCNNCGKKYRIDETKIKDMPVEIKCKSCHHRLRIGKSKVDNALSVKQAGGAPTSNVANRPEPSTQGDLTPEQDRAKQEVGGRTPSETKKIRFGLRGKMITLLLIVSLIPSGIFWSITFKENSKQVRQDTELLMTQTAEGLVNQVDEWIDKNIRVLKAGARLPEIASMDRFQQESALKAIAAEYPWMYLVFTVGMDGMNVARNDGKPLVSYADRDYFKNILSGKDFAWQTLIGRTNNKPALVIAVPIKVGEKLVGVMAASMTIEEISKNVAKWRKGQTGFAFLVDETGKVIAHPINDYVIKEKKLNTHPLVKAFQQAKGVHTADFYDEQGRLTVGYIRETNYGWALVIQQDQNEVLEPLQKMQRFALLLLLGTVLFVFLIAWLVAAQITKPIMALREAAERMSLGDLNVQLDIRSRDEIGALVESIGRMQTSMRLAINRLRRRPQAK